MTQKPRTLVRLALPIALLGGAGTGAALLSLPAAAGALPTSNTSCYGTLSKDASGPSQGEPDLLDYSFNCSNEISAYTIVVDRVKSDGRNVDDYDTNPEVIDSDGAVDATQSIQCGGTTPSNGINCYALNGSNAGFVGTGNFVQGSIDLTDQYCSYLPKAAKAGTPAVARAIVSVIVTDNSGAQDGPFELGPARPCPTVPAVVPAAKKPVARKPVAKRSARSKV